MIKLVVLTCISLVVENELAAMCVAIRGSRNVGDFSGNDRQQMTDKPIALPLAHARGVIKLNEQYDVYDVELRLSAQTDISSMKGFIREV